MTLLTLLLIWAMFAQIVLTLAILLKMRKVRFAAFKEGQVTLDQIAVNSSAWPDDVRKVQNSYTSQFELPILFYIACVTILTVGFNSWGFVILSWLFVISRVIHMMIHTGSNKIMNRFKAFVVGMVCVLLQWLYIVGYSTYLYL